MEKRMREHVWDWFKAILLAVMVTVALRNFLLIPIVVDGSSMEPSLQDNDYVIVESFSKVHRFDVIVFKDTKGRTYVKRVIGLPGEHVSYHDNQLYINGEKVAEPFFEKSQDKVDEGHERWTSDFKIEDLTGQETIAKNEYFVLGDNRLSSKDSRYFGTISEEDIIGKVRFVYWPFKQIHIIN